MAKEEISANFLNQILEYEDDLNRRAMSLFQGNESDSKDLVQDTILRALGNEEKFEKGTNLRAWLHTILFHLFVNRHRRKKKLNEIVDKHQSYTSKVNSKEAYRMDPYGPMEMEALLILLEDHLEEIFYDVLFLVDVKDMSYKETAAQLDIPVGTVMSRLYRARRKSQEVLLDHYDQEILEEYLDHETLAT